jgi:hypothetical protein
MCSSNQNVESVHEILEIDDLERTYAHTPLLHDDPAVDFVCVPVEL